MLDFFLKGFRINAICTFISRITGFVRDMFFAHFLGAGLHSDIFFIATKLPNLFRRITAEGALTSSFLPVYSGLLYGKDKQLAQDYSKIIFLVLLVSVIVITVLIQVFLKEVIIILAPGFLDNKALLADIVTLSRFTILFLPLISIVALFGSMLNASGRFIPFGILPIIINVIFIFTCLMISDDLEIKSLPLAISLPIAGIIQMIFIYLCAKKYKLVNRNFFKIFYFEKNIFNKLSEKLNSTLRRFFPALITGGIFQINILVDTLLASFLGFGSISFLYYADRLIQLPLGIIGIALGTTLLASLSHPKILNSKKKTSIQLENAIKIGLFFSIPSTLVLMFFPEIIVNAIFNRGNFSNFESKQTVIALYFYSFGLTFLIISKSCQSIFLAAGNPQKIMFISVTQLICNIILSIILMKFLKHGGIALATSCATILGTILYFKSILKEKKLRKGNYYSRNKEGLIYLIKYFFKIVICSFLMIVFLKLTVIFFQYINFEINLLYLVIFTMLGLIFYFFISYMTKLIPTGIFKTSQ